MLNREGGGGDNRLNLALPIINRCMLAWGDTDGKRGGAISSRNWLIVPVRHADMPHLTEANWDCGEAFQLTLRL